MESSEPAEAPDPCSFDQVVSSDHRAVEARPSDPIVPAAPPAWGVIAGLAVSGVLASGLYGWLTRSGRWSAASADGLFADHEEMVWGWFWRSTVAELAWWWWVIAVSGALGSFLNVVVYRMPRGMSLARTGSRCVHCQTPIRWFDNQPVLGWFLVGGRCRACREPISVRYPLVESLAILCGLWVFGVTVQAGWLLPPPAESVEVGTKGWHYWLLDRAPANRVVWFFYMLPLLFATLAAAVASWDRARLPIRFYATIGLMVTVGYVGYQLDLGPRLATWFGDGRWRSALNFGSTEWSPGWLWSLPLSDRPGLVESFLAGWIPRLICGVACGLAAGCVGGWTMQWLQSGGADRALWQAPWIFGLLGLWGGVWLTLWVAGLWLTECGLRGWLGGWGSPSTQSRKVGRWWILLPLDFLLGILVWRWTR